MSEEKEIAFKKRSFSILTFLSLFVLLGLFILTIIAFMLGGSHFVVLGFGAMLSIISLNLFLRFPKKKFLWVVLLCIGLLPLYLLLPGKGKLKKEALLEYRTLFSTSSPWFSGIPEKELLKMGETLGYTDLEKQSLEPIGELADSYEEIESSNLFQYNCSVILDSWFADRGHYWYLKSPKKKAPLLIFLHGSGGNFKAYQHWFVASARENEVAMAFPTWGFGLWGAKKLARRIDAVVADVKAKDSIDDERIFICGLSQGSFIGLKAVAQMSGQEKGFIAISGVPYLEGEEVKALSAVPLYLFHGDKDERAPVQLARKLAVDVKGLGGKVKYDEYEGQCHTLVKVKNKEIIARIFQWIQEVP